MTVRRFVHGLPPQPDYFRLVAFISTEGHVDFRHEEGTRTLDEIFDLLPRGEHIPVKCIVQAWHEYWLVDMLAVRVSEPWDTPMLGSAKGRRVQDYKPFQTEDAAIMAGILQNT